MTYQEFREKYPTFRDLYDYCMENNLGQFLFDWLDGDYHDSTYSENMYNSMWDFLYQRNIVKSPEGEMISDD